MFYMYFRSPKGVYSKSITLARILIKFNLILIQDYTSVKIKSEVMMAPLLLVVLF
jgi:hypothetical protein